MSFMNYTNTEPADVLAPGHQHTSHQTPDNKGNWKKHWENMGSIWGRQDQGGPHVVPMNLATLGT